MWNEAIYRWGLTPRENRWETLQMKEVDYVVHRSKEQMWTQVREVCMKTYQN